MSFFGSMKTVMSKSSWEVFDFLSPGTASLSPEAKTWVQSIFSLLTFTLMVTVTGSSHLWKSYSFHSQWQAWDGKIKLNYYSWFSCLFVYLYSAIARTLPTDRRDLGLTLDPDVTRWLTLSLILVLTLRTFPPGNQSSPIELKGEV